MLALGQLITETHPDGSVTTHAYNREGLPDQIKVSLKDGKPQPIINHIVYNANRQRTLVDYANGVTTTHAYEATTHHLINLLSTRPGKDAQGAAYRQAIQDIEYTYDPVGNITRSVDKTHETVFHNNQKVEPLSDYTYDALYRLTKANGRQHPGINAGTDRNNETDGSFKQSQYASLSDNQALENYQETYEYDAGGNLTKTTHTATNAWTRTNKILSGSNRLESMTTGNGTGNTQLFGHDKSGNLQQLNLNSTVELTWNCCDNLIKAVFIPREGVADDADYYVYDSDEMRTRRISERLANGGTITWKDEKRYLGHYETKSVSQIKEGVETTVLVRNTLRVMDGETCVAIIHHWEKDDAKREVEQAGTTSLRFQLGNHLGSVSLELDEVARIISYDSIIKFFCGFYPLEIWQKV